MAASLQTFSTSAPDAPSGNESATASKSTSPDSGAPDVIRRTISRRPSWSGGGTRTSWSRRPVAS